MTRKETMQIMLQDVVDQFVVNPKSRGLKNGDCKYNPENAKISPGCAIGMYLDVETCKQLDYLGDINCIFSHEQQSLLPNWMVNLGQNFLFDVQNFHDGDYNFTKTGISQFGIVNLKCLCKQYKLKMPNINKINMP